TGILLFFENKVSESISFLKNSAVQYNHPFYKGRIGWIYTITGQYDSAIDILEKTLVQHKERRPALLANLAAAYFHKGEKEKANELFDELEKKVEEGKANHAFYTASAYAFTGNTHKTLHFLYKAYEQHDIELLWLKKDPMLYSVKDLPFCAELLK